MSCIGGLSTYVPSLIWYFTGFSDTRCALTLAVLLVGGGS